MIDGGVREFGVDLNQARIEAINIAVGAGSILMGGFRDQGQKKVLRGEVDLVSDLDLKSGEYIADRLQRAFPKTTLLIEDFAKESGELKWLVDPLDGTRNRSRRDSNFAVSIALTMRDRVLLGVVYRPVPAEVLWAQEGFEGTWRNNEQIHVSDLKRLRDITFLCDWVADPAKRAEMLRFFESFQSRVGQIKSRSSAVSDMVTVAEGDAEVFVNFGLKPWDVAASSFIVQRAGGRVTTPFGEPWNIYNPDILATNDRIHDRVLEVARGDK